jgi:hypothetical protein
MLIVGVPQWLWGKGKDWPTWKIRLFSRLWRCWADKSDISSVLFDSYEIRGAKYLKTILKQDMHFWYIFKQNTHFLLSSKITIEDIHNYYFNFPYDKVNKKYIHVVRQAIVKLSKQSVTSKHSRRYKLHNAPPNSLSPVAREKFDFVKVIAFLRFIFRRRNGETKNSFTSQ